MPPHTNPALEKRFLLSLALTFAILIAEVLGRFWTGSLALLSDAAHVFMDVFALGLSYLLVVNLVVAFVLGGHEHRHDHAGEDGAEAHEEVEDLNVRSAFLHVVGDAVSSVGVILPRELSGMEFQVEQLP